MALLSGPTHPPMLGRKGMSSTWRKTLDVPPGHTLAYCRVLKGDVENMLFVCTVCGAYASSRCHKLGQECGQRRLRGATTTLRRVYDGLYPHYRDSSRLSSSARRGSAYLCFAARQPPPPEVGASGAIVAGFISTPG
eukprot:4357292-Pyramimonas_sp.AAC.1